MTLQKDINTLDAMMEDYEGGEYPNQERAIQRGIAALKRIQDARDIQPESACADLLPGETEERVQ